MPGAFLITEFVVLSNPPFPFLSGMTDAVSSWPSGAVDTADVDWKTLKIPETLPVRNDTVTNKVRSFMTLYVCVCNGIQW
mmetsp:Transcript_13198/g.24798  ORF Transcript_13198/g.24798 Transcript_13198/m.24798 type:complete len:80 (-) Transcript_13198:59-298(-)